MRKLFNLIVTLSVVVAASANAQQRSSTYEVGDTERRVALVIANSTYTVGPLKNPVNDARGMAQTLKNLGFDVMHRENLKQNDMKRAIRDFGAKIRRGGVGLFYFSGHAVQVGGENYLIPIDSAPNSEEEVEYEAVNAGLVLAQMASAKNSMNIMILDACRNNPFARSFRSTSDGLARMSAPNATLIAYATAPGSVTSEGSNVSKGIYTQELLKFIGVPGLRIEEVFKRVRIAVRKRTQNKQVPWEESSLTGNFYFAKNTTNSASMPGHDVEDKGPSGNEQTKSSIELNDVSAAKVQANAAAIYKRVRSLKKEDYAKAVAEYRQALRLEPKNALYHNALGITLKKKAEWDWVEMVRLQDKSRKKVEKKKMLLSLLAMAAAGAISGGRPTGPMPEWEIGRTPFPPFNIDEEIISALQAAVQLDPRKAKYHSDLGMAVFDSRNDINIVGTEAEEHAKARAEMAFRKAVRLEPNNPVFLSNLGNALNSQKKWAEAEMEYSKLLRLEPRNVSHHIGLFKALNGQSKWTNAAQVYIEIQRLKPNSFSKSLLSAEIKDNKALQHEIKRLKK